MVWAPTRSTRVAIKFWLDCLQVVTVVGAVITAATTFYYHNQEQRAQQAEQTRRLIEQNDRAKRELELPYDEKKLSLYLDAARVLAHLASSPSVDKEATEARFWELYWGELAFVESQTADEESGGPKPSVERLMVEFCNQYFEPSRCTSANAGNQARVGEAAAIRMARQASKEIRKRWESVGQ